MTIPVPGFPFEEEKDFGLVVSDATAGPILRGRRRPNVVRTFRFVSDLVPQSEKTSAFADFSTERGMAGRFSYTPTALGEAATTVRFGMDEIRATYQGGPAGHTIEFELVEDVKPS